MDSKTPERPNERDQTPVTQRDQTGGSKRAASMSTNKCSKCGFDMFPISLARSIANAATTLPDKWMANCGNCMCLCHHLYDHCQCLGWDHHFGWEQASPLQLAISYNNVPLVKHMLPTFTIKTLMALKMYPDIDFHGTGNLSNDTMSCLNEFRYEEDHECYIQDDFFPYNPLLYAEYCHGKDSVMYRAMSYHFKWQKVRDVVRARPYVLHWLLTHANFQEELRILHSERGIINDPLLPSPKRQRSSETICNDA